MVLRIKKVKILKCRKSSHLIVLFNTIIFLIPVSFNFYNFQSVNSNLKKIKRKHNIRFSIRSILKPIRFNQRDITT